MKGGKIRNKKKLSRQHLAHIVIISIFTDNITQLLLQLMQLWNSVTDKWELYLHMPAHYMSEQAHGNR